MTGKDQGTCHQSDGCVTGALRGTRFQRIDVHQSGGGFNQFGSSLFRVCRNWALKGNLHGGANEAAMDMLNEIMADTKDGALDVDAWMQRSIRREPQADGLWAPRLQKRGPTRWHPPGVGTKICRSRNAIGHATF